MNDEGVGRKTEVDSQVIKADSALQLPTGREYSLPWLRSRRIYEPIIGQKASTSRFVLTVISFSEVLLFSDNFIKGFITLISAVVWHMQWILWTSAWTTFLAISVLPAAGIQLWLFLKSCHLIVKFVVHVAEVEKNLKLVACILARGKSSWQRVYLNPSQVKLKRYINFEPFNSTISFESASSVWYTTQWIGVFGKCTWNNRIFLGFYVQWLMQI